MKCDICGYAHQTIHCGIFSKEEPCGKCGSDNHSEIHYYEMGRLLEAALKAKEEAEKRESAACEALGKCFLKYEQTCQSYQELIKDKQKLEGIFRFSSLPEEVVKEFNDIAQQFWEKRAMT